MSLYVLTDYWVAGYAEGDGAAVVTGPSSGRGLSRGGRKRRDEELTFAQWQALSELRDKLADMEVAKRAPAKVVAAVKREVGRVRVEVPPDVWTPPAQIISVAELQANIAQFLDYMAKIDAMETAAREAWEQEMRDDDEAAAMLLLH